MYYLFPHLLRCICRKARVTSIVSLAYALTEGRVLKVSVYVKLKRIVDNDPCKVVIVLQKWTIHRGIRRKSGSPPCSSQTTDENPSQVESPVVHRTDVCCTSHFMLFIIVIPFLLFWGRGVELLGSRRALPSGLIFTSKHFKKYIQLCLNMSSKRMHTILFSPLHVVFVIF